MYICSVQVYKCPIIPPRGISALAAHLYLLHDIFGCGNIDIELKQILMSFSSFNCMQLAQSYILKSLSEQH